MKINIYIILTGVMLSFVSCGKKQAEEAKQDHVIDTQMLENLPKAEAKLEEINTEIRLNGRIVPDESKQTSVYALVSGRISEVNVELGDYVRKGQTLAILKSAEVAGVNNELALATSNIEIARKNMETQKELYESNLVAEREYITARAEYQKAQSELEKAKQIASITGGENSMYKLTTALNGYVIAKNITNNSEVRSDMAEPLFSIADLSEVWVLADVFESDLNRITLGQKVIVNTLSNPDKTYDGKIDKIYNVLDPQTRSMKVRVSLANPTGEFKPGMFVSMKVNINEKDKVVVIPDNAIVFDDNHKFVIVLNPGNQPEIRPIREIRRTENRCYVEGVKEGEKVITASQVFLFEALSAKQK